MDEQPACNAALSGDAQSIIGGARSNGNPGLSCNASGLGNSDNAGDGDGNGLKKRLFNLVPPASIAVIISFWAFGPESWIKNPWSIVVVGALTTAFVQALEWVNERHAGWRLDRREFATDLFYVILGNTVIRLAEDPLKASRVGGLMKKSGWPGQYRIE